MWPVTLFERDVKLKSVFFTELMTGSPTPPIWGKCGRLHHDACDDHDHSDGDSTNHTTTERTPG